MPKPGHPSTIWQTWLAEMWKWPIPLSALLLAVLGHTASIETVLARDLLIVGGGALLCGILLWFVALRIWEAHPDRYPGQDIRLQRAVIAPLMMSIGCLIVSSGMTLLSIPNNPMAIKITGIVLVLLILAVAIIVMIRARRIFSARSKK